MGEELSFCELRKKDIVNVADGRRLGRIVDLIFSPESGCVLGIVAPFSRKLFKSQEVYIPLINIKKIGPDVILVKLNDDLSRFDSCIDIEKHIKRGKGCYGRYAHDKKDDCHDDRHDRCHDGHHGGHGDRHDDGRGRYNYERDKDNCRRDNDCNRPKEPDCDKKCDKCLLFDCSNRWCDFFDRRF